MTTRSTWLGQWTLRLCMALGWLSYPACAAVRQSIAAPDLLVAQWPGGLVANAAFMPPADAAAEHSPFRGTLSLTESEMTIKPRPLVARKVLGRDAMLFPGVALSFFTHNGDLVPFTQDVIRFGSTASGRSFWDVIVQPGRVWSEPADAEWSRAAFPFALVNSIEGETHNGVATFLYKAGKVSNLRFQIVQQTAPFYVKGNFVAAGLIPATFVPMTADGGATGRVAKERVATDRVATEPVAAGRVAQDRIDTMTRTYEASLADQVRIADWKELAAKTGGVRLAGFDGKMPVGDIVLAGLDYEGTFYLEECRSAAGPLPWCDRARFGVWSATKALANETALLRLAEKYGASVFDLKIADYVPEAARHPGWENVRFQDAIDMATGIGNGSGVSEPNDINDGYLHDDYALWYEARSVQEKVTALLDAGRVYPWGPGKVARYRDQDMFLLGLAMNNFLKSKEGTAADLWSMLEKEVFEPIGIRYAPVNRTIEPDGSRGQPLMAYGYYPTIGDMVRIARLYQNSGKFGDTQILYAPRIATLLAGREPRGLPTGEKLTFGETTYTNAFWVAPYRSSTGCEIYYPRMIGWGGNIVALLPHGMIGIRLAKSGGTPGNAEVDTAGMARVAERLEGVCN
ncbi:MAG TPA: serine hydrolase domain-containing protein [Steroidobacteraceae bacterium]|nr:serine hydrolase domain-containing protein [Steroidobacteraceae bacterium]